MPRHWLRKIPRQYLSNELICPPRTNQQDEPVRERSVAEPEGPGAMSRALNAAWVRPVLFLLFIVVAWDLTIRLFRIPPYQIPAPADVVAVLWSDWPELLRQAWPTT